MAETLDEAGRMLSTANMGTLQKAMASMKAAMQTVLDLLAKAGGGTADGEDPTAGAPEEEAAHGADGQPLQEGANMAEWLESRLHSQFTQIADDLFGGGCLMRDERIALSSAIGSALDAFHQAVLDTVPQLFERPPYSAAPEAPDMGSMAESPVHLESDLLPLVEKAVAGDGTVLVKIIQPGWGSSGYYPSEVLKRDGPKVFKAGTHMYVNHPTATEEAQRPERDVRDLAAVLVSDAEYRETSSGGPGLYARAKVFGDHQAWVEERAPYVGTSIRALGKARPGEVEGRKGMVVESLDVGRSVDFVTLAGAGGRVLEEAALIPAAPIVQQEETEMTEQEAKALQEANAALQTQVRELTQNLGRLTEALLLNQATAFVERALAGIAGLHEETRKRLASELVSKAPVADGALDEGAFKTLIETRAQAELAYLASVAGSGQIRGMGAAAAPSTGDVQKRLAESFVKMGLTPDAAQRAAAGR